MMDSPLDPPSQSHQGPLDKPSTGFAPPTLEQQEEWNRIGLARLEADQVRFQKYMAAMGRDIEKRKADLGIQRLVLQNALLYAKDNTAWLDCSCQFCVLMRYLRQHESLDKAGRRLWQDESYQIARSYLEKRDIKTCECEFCREMGKENVRQNGQTHTISAHSSQVTGATAVHGSAKGVKSAVMPVAVKEPLFSTKLPTEYSGAKTMKLVCIPHPPRISKFFPVIQTNTEPPKSPELNCTAKPTKTSSKPKYFPFKDPDANFTYASVLPEGNAESREYTSKMAIFSLF